jgi:hypothetical protein
LHYHETAAHSSISLRDLLGRLYRGKYIIFASCVVALGLAVAWLKVTHPSYTSRMVVAAPLVTQSPEFGGGGALASLGLGGLLNASTEPFRRYQDLLTSRSVAERLESDHHVLKLVFADRWDEAHQTWKAPTGFVADLRSAVKGFFGRPDVVEPGISDLVGVLEGDVLVSTPSSNSPLTSPSPLRFVSFTAGDPQLAANMLRWVHEETDQVLRENEIKRTRGMITYLTGRLRDVSIADERTALTQLLLDEEKQDMLLETGVDYAAEVLDPASVPGGPSFPRIGLTLVLAVIGGFGIGSLISLGRQGVPVAEARTSLRGRGAFVVRDNPALDP